MAASRTVSKSGGGGGGFGPSVVWASHLLPLGSGPTTVWAVQASCLLPPGQDQLAAPMAQASPLLSRPLRRFPAQEASGLSGGCLPTELSGPPFILPAPPTNFMGEGQLGPGSAHQGSVRGPSYFGSSEATSPHYRRSSLLRGAGQALWVGDRPRLHAQGGAVVHPPHPLPSTSTSTQGPFNSQVLGCTALRAGLPASSLGASYSPGRFPVLGLISPLLLGAPYFVPGSRC